MLEKVIEGVAEESSPEVRVQLLSAVMKMFFKRPPECQEMLGRLLEYTISKSIITLAMTLTYLSKEDFEAAYNW